MTLSYFISSAGSLLDDEGYLKMVLRNTDNKQIRQYIKELLRDEDERKERLHSFYRRARRIILGDLAY